MPDRELADGMSEVVLGELKTQQRTVAWLARTIGMPQPTLHQRLHGKGNIPIDDWAAIARALGLSFNELVVAGRRKM